jgi:hypothetical protein
MDLEVPCQAAARWHFENRVGIWWPHDLPDEAHAKGKQVTHDDRSRSFHRVVKLPVESL